MAGSPAAAASSVPAARTPASAVTGSGVASGPGVATGGVGTLPLTPATYRNPVSKSFADTYADPDVVRGPDGWWYGYATSDPLHSGEDSPHFIPMSKSRDLVHWRYAGDAFTASTLPSWADAANGAALWAPDVHYAGGQWRMYYVVTQTTVTAGLNDNAIGMATGPTPLGPWTDSGGPVVGPRHGTNASDPNDWLWTYDPEVARDVDGTAFSSRDGHTWTRGGTWTLPAGSSIRVGLESMGASSAPGAPAPAVASFDYFRVYTP